MYYDELYHHGILGMHWGIRRYQNKDGSLTAEGIKRYRTDTKFKAKYDKYEAKQKAKKEKAASEEAKRQEDETKKKAEELKKKPLSELTDEELTARIVRLEGEKRASDLERQLKQNENVKNLEQQTANKGKEFIKTTGNQFLKVAATQIGNKLAMKAVQKMFGEDAATQIANAKKEYEHQMEIFKKKTQLDEMARAEKAIKDALVNGAKKGIEDARSAKDEGKKDSKETKYSYDLIDAYSHKPSSWEGSPSSIFGTKKGTNDSYSNFLNDTKTYGDSQKMTINTLANTQHSWESSPSSIFNTPKSANNSYSNFLSDTKSYGDSLKMAKTTLANDAYTKYESFASKKSNRESIDAGKNWLSGVMDSSSRSVINKTANYNDKSNAISKSTVTYDAPKSKTTNTKYTVTNKKLLRHSDDAENDEKEDFVMDGVWIIKKKNDRNFLRHMGVLGMHWGERRYQNEDGSLTPEGREHYGVGEARDSSEEPIIRKKDFRPNSDNPTTQAIFEALKIYDKLENHAIYEEDLPELGDPFDDLMYPWEKVGETPVKSINELFDDAWEEVSREHANDQRVLELNRKKTLGDKIFDVLHPANTIRAPWLKKEK